MLEELAEQSLTALENIELSATANCDNTSSQLRKTTVGSDCCAASPAIVTVESELRL
jgi:hypothetical protein